MKKIPKNSKKIDIILSSIESAVIYNLENNFSGEKAKGDMLKFGTNIKRQLESLHRARILIDGNNALIRWHSNAWIEMKLSENF